VSDEAGGEPATRGPVLTLLHRAYCHLCDEMQDALRPIAAAHGATVTIVDVDAHVELESAWGDSVPVLFLGAPAPGALLCRYRLDAARVDEALRAAAVAPAPDFR